MTANDFNDRPAHKGFPETARETASAPTWKRFSDAPPPDGFYWSRWPNDIPPNYTIKEVCGETLYGFGSDGVEDYLSTSPLEYYSQPILPPA